MVLLEEVSEQSALHRVCNVYCDCWSCSSCNFLRAYVTEDKDDKQENEMGQACR
jgi:hypothetical protein